MNRVHSDRRGWGSERWSVWLFAVACVLGLGAVARAQHRGIFDVGGERAQRAVVTLGESLPELGADESEMTRLFKGVLADLRGKGLEELRGCVPPAAFLGEPAGAERVCVVHLYGTKATKKVDVLRTPEGGFVAVELDVSEGHKPARAELKRDQTAALIASWPQYRGGFSGDAVKEPRGEVFELAKPYLAGRVTLDSKTLGDRFLRGAKTNLSAADRVLEQEQFWARLPKGYDPKHPAGLLVWVDPGNLGKPPACMAGACDELGLICVGAAGAGNNRLVTNREQLALDAVATVSARYHVDPRRVYITGMSGGGRVSSMMVGCFPDVFAGAVPIVGLACYENVPNGTGRMWPRAYVRPKTEMFNLFKTRRVGALTGDKDFNQIEMQHATAIMQKDGAQVRLFEHPTMAHEMPTAEWFEEAMKWVDEPRRVAIEAEAAAAAKALEAYTARSGKNPPSDDAGRRLLHRALDSGPWSPAAWEAVVLLGVPERAP